jgi:hypothetical protein
MSWRTCRAPGTSRQRTESRFAQSGVRSSISRVQSYTPVRVVARQERTLPTRSRRTSETVTESGYGVGVSARADIRCRSRCVRQPAVVTQIAISARVRIENPRSMSRYMKSNDVTCRQLYVRKAGRVARDDWRTNNNTHAIHSSRSPPIYIDDLGACGKPRPPGDTSRLILNRSCDDQLFGRDRGRRVDGADARW